MEITAVSWGALGFCGCVVIFLIVVGIRELISTIKEMIYLMRYQYTEKCKNIDDGNTVCGYECRYRDICEHNVKESP